MEPDNGQAASASRKWLYLSLVILLLGLIIAGAFLMGTRRPEVLSNTAATPTPSPEISPTPTPEVTPILTPKITAKPTSTLKPAPTVTPTPTTAPVSQTTIINSIVSLDGFRANNNGGNNGKDVRYVYEDPDRSKYESKPTVNPYINLAPTSTTGKSFFSKFIESIINFFRWIFS